MKKLLISLFIIIAFSSCKNNNNEITNHLNPIVENPVKNQVTNEISEKLIGRYEVIDSIVDYYENMLYFEIRADGTMEISQHTFSGPAISTEENIQLMILYTDTKTILSFQRIGGENTFVGNSLALDFIGDYDCTYFISITYKSHALDEELKFIKVS
ncbi:MAG: hypothetical protein FWD48_07550 [Oscillospiraceae bacterium]|nr:hypothetical protein [Oscillospiraceae bacterium]